MKGARGQLSYQNDSTHNTEPRLSRGNFVSLGAVAPAFQRRFAKLQAARQAAEQEFLAQGGQCFMCRDTGYVGPHKPCPLAQCEAGKTAARDEQRQRISSLLAGAGIDIIKPDKSFASWPGKEQTRVLLQRWVHEFPYRDREVLFRDRSVGVPEYPPFLLLHGPTGTGKSTLAALVLRKAIERAVQPGWLCSAPELLNSQRGIPDEEAFVRAQTTPLVVLDDIGITKRSDFTDERLYLLVHYRWERRLWTVFTTNGEPNAPEFQRLIGLRTYWRIMQYAQVVPVLGENLRNQAGEFSVAGGPGRR